MTRGQERWKAQYRRVTYVRTVHLVRVAWTPLGSIAAAETRDEGDASDDYATLSVGRGICCPRAGHYIAWPVLDGELARAACERTWGRHK